MHFQTQALLLSSLTAFASAAFCPVSWGFQEAGGLSSAAVIDSATVTVTVPPLPASITDADILYLWPGVINSNILAQPVLSHKGYCASPEGYCVFGGRYNGQAANGFVHSTPVPVSVGDELVMKIEYDGNGNTTQTVSRGGTVITELDIAGKDAYIFHLRAEYDGSTPAHSPAFTWKDLQLVFSEKMPNLPSIIKTANVTASAPTTPDGGITWNVASVAFHSVACPSS